MEKGRPTKIQDLTKLFKRLSDQARKNKEKNDKEFEASAIVRPIANDSQYGGQRKLLDRERLGKDARASLAVYEDKDVKKDGDSVQRAMNKDVVIINPDLDPDSEDSVIKGKNKDKKETGMSESYADIVKRVVLGESRSEVKRWMRAVREAKPGAERKHAEKKLSELLKQIKADGGHEYVRAGKGPAGKKLAAKRAAAPKVEPKPSADAAAAAEKEQTELQKYNKVKIQRVVSPLVGTKHVSNRDGAAFMKHVTDNVEHIRNKARKHDHWENDPEKAIQTVALSHYKDATSDDAISRKNIERAAAAISAVRK